MAAVPAVDAGDRGNGGFGCFGSFVCARRNIVAVVVVEPKRRGVPARFRTKVKKMMDYQPQKRGYQTVNAWLPDAFFQLPGLRPQLPKLSSDICMRHSPSSSLSHFQTTFGTSFRSF